MGEWKKVKLGEVCEILNGYAFDSKNFTNDNSFIPLIRIRDVKKGYSETFFNGKFSNQYIICKGDILVGMDGEFNVGIWNSKNSLLNQRVCKLIPDENRLDERFIYYFLPKALKKIEDKTAYVTVKHISSKQIKNIEIPCISLIRQKEIAAILDKANELIALRKKQLAELDTLAESIYNIFFSNIKGIHIKLGDVIRIQNGLVNPNEHPYCNFIHVGGANIESDTGTLINTKLAKDENLISGKYYFDTSMVLYSKIRPNLNKVLLPKFSGICSADIYPLIPYGKYINRIFLKYLLTRKDFISYAINNSGRANIPKINREALNAYEFNLPPLPLQNKFAGIIEKIEEEKELVRRGLKESEDLFQRLMQDLFKPN